MLFPVCLFPPNAVPWKAGSGSLCPASGSGRVPGTQWGLSECPRRAGGRGHQEDVGASSLLISANKYANDESGNALLLSDSIPVTQGVNLYKL